MSDDAGQAPTQSERDRRRDPRRTLPFTRSALLQVNARDHLVALVDVSRGGAFVSTRAVVPHDAALSLKLWLPSSGGELVLPSKLVRVMPQGEGKPAGVALRFQALTPEALRRLDEFVEIRGHPRRMAARALRR